ncbi:hypothetical protein [Flavobacterium lindanitolerans]|uniref:hypothetical protein n=1 Tax=Flavobacterium lindanitolerans TaxID=428988 RepID=UPI002807E674|nr:hypothetical protein [Flavobacterium lindanitolerans]MDQ7961703.1 hypothetical protein [Flavobacterium lindanitolerans]
MKNYFIKISILFLAVSFGSCSNDDSSPSATNTEFFNINVGNRWVYKKYDFDFSNPGVYTFSGQTETVEVTEIVTVNGFTFSKLKHTKTFENNLTPVIEYEFLRIDEQGHLRSIYTGTDETMEHFVVNEGFVQHPGTDSEFQFVQEYPWGTINYNLAAETEMSVENNNYRVLPYKGVFLPTDPDSASKTVEYNYQAQVGLVKRVCHAAFSNYSWEDRLVSYTLVP